MAGKFRIIPTIHSYPVKTVALGKPETAAGANNAEKYTFNDQGKPVKLATDNSYEICADGNAIEAIISSSEFSASGGATRGGRSIGGIWDQGYFEFTVSGAAVVIGDYIVAAAQTAVNVPLANPDAFPAKKAAVVADTAIHAKRSRVVSLGVQGTGAVGTVCVAEFIG